MTVGGQILVTGGTGFMGRYVVRQLLAQGDSVRLLCRSEAKARRLFGDRVDCVVGDLTEPASLHRACRHVATVLHLGGLYQFGPRAARTMLAVNHTGTGHLCQAAWDQRVERMLHVSSSSVLDYSVSPITERAFPTEISRRQAYRYSKWLGEKCALDWAKRGLPVVIASPTSPVGAEDETPTPTSQVIVDFLNRNFPFSTRTTMNFVDVAELAAGLLRVAESGHVGERYLLGHHNLWLSDLLRTLGEVTGLPAPRHNLPWIVIALAGIGGELGGSNRVCWETALHATKTSFFDFQKAADELGWRATRPLADSLRDAVMYFQQRATQPADLPVPVPANANASAS